MLFSTQITLSCPSKLANRIQNTFLQLWRKPYTFLTGVKQDSKECTCFDTLAYYDLNHLGLCELIIGELKEKEGNTYYIQLSVVIFTVPLIFQTNQ